VVALECCLEQLEPKPRDLENADNRLIWCNRVQCIRPIIQVMKSLIPRPSQQQIGNGDSEARFHAQLFGEKSAHYLQNCRCVFILSDHHINGPSRDTSLFLEWDVFHYLRVHNYSPYTPSVNLRAVIQKGFHGLN
jgi:hypothetical protein